MAGLANQVAPGTAAPVAAALTPASAGDVIGALMPERAIVVDESNTSRLLLSQLDLSYPTMYFAGIAEGMGVPARRVHTAEEFADPHAWRLRRTRTAPG